MKVVTVLSMDWLLALEYNKLMRKITCWCQLNICSKQVSAELGGWHLAMQFMNPYFVWQKK
jgi:hypothetical protein